MECCFFGKYVPLILGQLASGDMTNAVVLVNYAKIKPFRGCILFFFFEIINSLFCYIYREFHSLSIGNPSIQNVYGATQILFNPDVEESAALRERLDIKSFNGVSIVLIISVPEVLSHE